MYALMFLHVRASAGKVVRTIRTEGVPTKKWSSSTKLPAAGDRQEEQKVHTGDMMSLEHLCSHHAHHFGALITLVRFTAASN